MMYGVSLIMTGCLLMRLAWNRKSSEKMALFGLAQIVVGVGFCLFSLARSVIRR